MYAWRKNSCVFAKTSHLSYANGASDSLLMVAGDSSGNHSNQGTQRGHSNQDSLWIPQEETSAPRKVCGSLCKERVIAVRF
jgi:hypothetical protein